ncbi:HAD-like domain-containing protein [Nemania serpens]|nr:HAD-like domain-containing protein [Nemania serpens]
MASSLSEGVLTKELGSKTSFGFVFDVDGVLVKGSEALPAARETIKMLQKEHLPFILLTNGGGHTEEAHVALISERLGVTISKDQFVQSHTPFLDLVPQYQDRNILVLGGCNNGIRDIARTYGFRKVFTSSDLMQHFKHIHPFPEMTRLQHSENAVKTSGTPPGVKGEEIAAILVWSSPRDWCLDLQVIHDLLLSSNGTFGEKSAKAGDVSLPNNGFLQDGQPKLYFCNPDFEWATQHAQPRFAQGAFIRALEGIWNYSTNGKGILEYSTIGKPTRAAFQYGERMLRRYNDRLNKINGTSNQIKSVYMVGDNPQSDITGANNYQSAFDIEWKSVLVETGVYVAGTVPAHKPSHIARNVQDAVKWAIEVERTNKAPLACTLNQD